MTCTKKLHPTVYYQPYSWLWIICIFYFFTKTALKTEQYIFWLIKRHRLCQNYWSVLRILGMSCYLPHTQPCCLLSCGVSASRGRAKATDHEIFHFPSKTPFSSSAAKKKQITVMNVQSG